MAVKTLWFVTLTEDIASSASTNYALFEWRSQAKSAVILP
jgi:hypothetical protein